MPRRLCILSGNLMRCDAFIPALTSLSRDDELEIIRDRRRGAASSEATNRPVEERRCRPYLDLALKVDGFAIVPWSPEPAAPLPALTAPARPCWGGFQHRHRILSDRREHTRGNDQPAAPPRSR